MGNGHIFIVVQQINLILEYSEAYPEAIFLVMLGTSSFLVRHKLFSCFDSISYRLATRAIKEIEEITCV